MHDLQFVDDEYEGQPVRYYFSIGIETIQEPSEQDRKGSLLERLRHGKIPQAEVLQALRQMPLARVNMDSVLVRQRLKEAVEKNILPKQILELLPPIEQAQEVNHLKVR